MTRVKICGLTRERDARLATQLGVWACGFVLGESPRRVTPARARELGAVARAAARAAPGRTPPLTVAVVTTGSAEAVAQALDDSGCEAVQLAAGGDGASVRDVRAAARARGLRPLVIAAAAGGDAVAADLLLLDARLPGRYGGTGRTVDWRAAAPFTGGGRLVLAGGLTPGNVGAAIGAARPFAVDVAGGVESSPGVKDGDALTRFFAAVAAAGAGTAAGSDRAGAVSDATTSTGAHPASRPGSGSSRRPR